MMVHRIFLVGSVALLLNGCGDGSTGQVSGKVKLDGKPLADAVVEFYPKETGAASAARTDSDGNYQLRMGRESTGALIGEHKVQIWSSLGQETEDSVTAKENIPAKYNVKSELTRAVTSGYNTFDFELESSAADKQSKKR